MENLAGLGTDVYIGLKSDLTKPLVAEGPVYKLAEGVTFQTMFKSGSGLWKVQCKDDSQQIQGSSLGPNNGYELTCNFVVDKVNEKTAELSRALNNRRDIFIIALDGEKSQIMYDNQRRVKFEQGGITSDTGAAPGDERQTSYSAKISPVNYDHLYVQTPEDGWDSLLYNAKKRISGTDESEGSPATQSLDEDPSFFNDEEFSVGDE